MLSLLADLFALISGAVALAAAIACSLHLLLRKRNEAAAIAWLGVVWLLPLLGPALYAVLGINRIARRAARLGLARPPAHGGRHVPPPVDGLDDGARLLLERQANLPADPWQPPFTAGNRVQLLDGGAAAYPAMLEAIRGAGRSVALQTYILNLDDLGGEFVEALADAVRRGCDVRVLVDGVGSYYGWPPVTGALREAGVPTARFLHSFVPWRMPYLNLRNHKKILVVDGTLGFTGGFNIQAIYSRPVDGRGPYHDLHARIEGPLVGQMMHVFAEDWAFATAERLDGRGWFPEQAPAGGVVARGLSTGPEADDNALRLVLMAALTQAQRRVRVVTPYFLPDEPLMTVLRLAALRGAEVDVVLPAEGNIGVVEWAMMARLAQLLEAGVRIWRSAPPFDHTKLCLIDDAWWLFGSANWDQRSLRLNFEFNVECVDGDLARRAGEIVARRMAKAVPLRLADLAARPLPVKLRDAAARLLAPIL